MARRSRRSGKKNVVSVDMTGVETGGKYKVPVAGVYALRIVDIEVKDKDGNKYIKFSFEVSGGEYDGSKVWDNVSLQVQALFKFKALLLSAGYEVSDSKMDYDLDELIGLEVTAELEEGEYNGKAKSIVNGYLFDEDAGDESDEDVEELLDELEKADLKSLAKELGVSSKKLKTMKKLSAIKEEILENYEDDEILESYDELFGDEEDEDDQEEEEEIDYTTMTLKELRAECKERDISYKKEDKKRKLIKKLEADDDNDLPF